MGIEVGGLFGLILLAAVIWALINIVQSRASTLAKVVWILVVLVFPFLGVIVWLIAGPRTGRA